jgi:mannose-6-phosphate isomerase-like protein (cupin superfamily)
MNEVQTGGTMGEPWPESLEAMTAAPGHHTVLLENDQVRVLDTRIGPGERTPVHTHQWPGVLYILSWSDFVRYDADGKVLVDFRTITPKPEPGMTLWSGPLGPHSAENVGTGELRVIAVEVKRPA